MVGKLVTYGMIALLAAALIGGSAYIILRPDAGRSATAQQLSEVQGGGAGGGTGSRNGGESAIIESPRSGKSSASGDGGTGPNKGTGSKYSGFPGGATGGRGLGNGSTEAGLSNPSEPLTSEEITGAVSLLEEEKLARDTYGALYRMWGDEIFQRIAESEQSHMDALIGLLERAGVTDPMAAYGPGEFPTAAMQELYDQLIARGGTSLAAALQVGGAIEELDILDIQRLQAESGNPELLRVLENLRQGSIRHLGAYSSAYERETGGVYAPQYLNQEEYDLLMGGGPGRGKQGGPGAGGKGNGGFPG
jgi:hypothetical protein